MPTDSFDVVRARGVDTSQLDDVPQVFHGSMFPKKSEWIHMQDHYDHYIPLRPEERAEGADKFVAWYPAHAGEIKEALRTPHDFENEREVHPLPRAPL